MEPVSRCLTSIQVKRDENLSAGTLVYSLSGANEMPCTNTAPPVPAPIVLQSLLIHALSLTSPCIDVSTAIIMPMQQQANLINGPLGNRDYFAATEDVTVDL